MQSSTVSVKRKTLYIYIPGLYPYGLLYCPQVTEALFKLKSPDVIIYQRTSTNLKTELSNFKRFIEMFKRNYNKFVIIGHSYGAVYAKYFSANIPGSVYVSLDGSDLKETCAYIAYDLLNIDRSKKIYYTGDYPVCDGHNLVKEWFEPTVQATIKDYGKNILEVSWREWIRNTKIVNKLHPVNSLIFAYYPNPEHPNKVAIVKRGSLYEIYYGKTYSHSLHMDRTVCSAILKIIDTKGIK
jgi:hypothetical protein